MSKEGNRNAVFWEQEKIIRAEMALDVWASVKRAKLERCGQVPTIEAIFQPDLSHVPMEDRPNVVKVSEKQESSKKQLREMEDGRKELVWLSWFVDRYIERYSKSATDAPLPASAAIQITVDGWLSDIGSPILLQSYLMAMYPRQGVYEASGSFSPEWLFGVLKPGASAKHFDRGFGALHRLALRDLADYLADFGTREGGKFETPRRRHAKPATIEVSSGSLRRLQGVSSR